MTNPQTPNLEPISPQGAQQAQPQNAGAPDLEPITPNSSMNVGAAPPSGHHVTQTAFGENQPGFNLRGAGNALVSGIGGALEGAGEGVFSTLAGGADVINKGLNKAGIKSQIPTQTLHELAGDSEQQSTAEKLGYGGETLTEFMLGDEALKALSQADKLAQVSKTMKILEKSPRTMMALRAGANALRAGAVQGAQSYVRSGGDTGQALNDAKHMAEIAGPLGIVGEGLGKVGEGISKGVKGFEALQEAGANPPATHLINEDVKNAIDKSENNLHQNYENHIQNFNTRLSGVELDPTDSTLPMAQKADSLLQKPVPGDHELETDLKKSLKEGLTGDVKSLLGKIRSGFSNPDVDLAEDTDIKLPKSQGTATGGNQLGGATTSSVTTKRYQWLESNGTISSTPTPNGKLVDLTQLDPAKFDFTNGTYTGQVPKDAVINPLEPYNIDNLIGIRQLIRRKIADVSSSLGPGNTNAKTLRELLGSVDDTIGTLAQHGNDPGLAQEYSALRQDYKSKIGIYDDPVINNIREGKYSDAAKQVLSGGNTMAPRLQNLRTILGDTQFNEFSRDVFDHLLDASKGAHGEVNPLELLNNWGKVPEESRNALFGNQGVPRTQINQLMNDAKTAKNLQYLSRVGVIGPLVAQGGFIYHMGIIGALLGAGAGVAGAKLGGVRQLVDYVADHPNTWKTWGLIGKGLQSATAGSAVTGAIGQTATGANTQAAKRKVLNSASGLAGQ